MREYVLEDILRENIRRNQPFRQPYNPITGEGSTAIPRIWVTIKDYAPEARDCRLYLPEDMIRKEEGVQDLIRDGSFRNFIASRDNISPAHVTDESIQAEIIEFCKIRMEYDFEYWAYTTVLIKDKVSGLDVPFRLNFPQRNVLLQVLESQRRAEIPIRVILLKARQWGGSTLVQLYMLWIQMIHRTGWNSVIAAHEKSASRNIKGMVSKAILHYPEFMGSFKLARWEGSNSTSIITGRNNKITIGSSQVPDSIRSTDVVMAHLSEVAYWREAEKTKPEELATSIVASVLRVPDSLVVMESTARGTGNFFHKEWLEAKRGESDKIPVFVAWWQIEIYSEKVQDYKALLESFTDYHWEMWDAGASLEAINWWRGKYKELRASGLDKMKSEYPTTAEEAFVSTGSPVFTPRQCDLMRKSCCEPAFVGELAAEATIGKKCKEGIHFVPYINGKLKIWDKPETEPWIVNRYIVVVDVGGRSEKADYSVICVIDRSDRIGLGPDKVVAQWRGHIDHDLLCWKAVQIAQYYNKALLVIESNTLETHATDGDHTQYILEVISDVYNNLYSRDDPDKVRMGVPLRYGFHTNAATKTAIIDNEVRLYRETGYIERDDEAVNEHNTYEKQLRGGYAAKSGHHDDILMTRAIGMYISETMPQPVVKPRKFHQRIKKALGLSGFG